MASEIDICNLALQWLGQNPITNLLNPTTRAEQLCALNYPLARLATLEARPWSFALRRFKLETTQRDEWNTHFAFVLPTTIIRPWRLYRQIDLSEPQEVRQWSVEDGVLLADVNTVYMKAIVDVRDSTKYTPCFVQALAARLAGELAIPITENIGLQDRMLAIFDMKLHEASSIDGGKGSREKFKSNTLTGVR